MSLLLYKPDEEFDEINWQQSFCSNKRPGFIFDGKVCGSNDKSSISMSCARGALFEIWTAELRAAQMVVQRNRDGLRYFEALVGYNDHNKIMFFWGNPPNEKFIACFGSAESVRDNLVGSDCGVYYSAGTAFVKQTFAGRGNIKEIMQEVDSCYYPLLNGPWNNIKQYRSR